MSTDSRLWPEQYSQGLNMTLEHVASFLQVSVWTVGPRTNSQWASNRSPEIPIRQNGWSSSCSLCCDNDIKDVSIMSLVVCVFISLHIPCSRHSCARTQHTESTCTRSTKPLSLQRESRGSMWVCRCVCCAAMWICSVFLCKNAFFLIGYGVSSFWRHCES